MFYRKQHVDLGLMRKTYLCILYTMTDCFDQAAALKVFNDWETSKYHPQVNESQLKLITRGSDTEGYNEWKDEFEPKEVKEEKKVKNTKIDNYDSISIDEFDETVSNDKESRDKLYLRLLATPFDDTTIIECFLKANRKYKSFDNVLYYFNGSYWVKGSDQYICFYCSYRQFCLAVI